MTTPRDGAGAIGAPAVVGSGVCETGISRAATAYGVPERMLLVVGLTEAGTPTAQAPGAVVDDGRTHAVA